MIQFLLHHEGFEISGLKMIAGFDTDSNEIRKVGIKEIYPIAQLESVCSEKDVQVGMIMVPMEDAQKVCNQLVSIGVEGIWNFTPMHLNVPDHIVLQNESFTASITKLRMQMKERSEAS